MHRTTLPACFFVALFALGPVRTAQAAILVRFPTFAHAKAQERFGAALEDALSKEVRIVGRVSPQAMPSVEASPKSLAALSRARAGYRTLDLDTTAAALEEVWRDCLSPERLASCAPTLFEASILRGAIALAKGDEASAAWDLRTAHAMAPHAVVDPKVFSPKVVAAFARACAPSFAPAPREVILHSKPAGAAISVDGTTVEEGASMHLSDARHVVIARLAGHSPALTVLEVRPGDGPLVQTLELEPSEDESAFLDLQRLISADPLNLSVPGAKELLARFDIEGVLLVGRDAGLAPTSIALPGRGQVWTLPDLDLAAPSLSPSFLDAVRLALDLPRSHSDAQGPPALAKAEPTEEEEGSPDEDELNDEEERALLYTPAKSRDEQSRREQTRKVLRSPWLWLGLGAVIAVVGGVVIGISVTD
ncbi:MAG: hypothetical protein MUC50_17165 [Myxococcota bacterium]|jgi:hypothetical protein|nr:hypothetical protein [Myxococcota bacterium]